MTVQPFPMRGAVNWDLPLKSYIDSLIAASMLGGQIAYASNETGTATVFLTTVTPIPNVTISIPATDAEVWIQWAANLHLTVAGQGAAYTILYETTGGSAVAVDSTFTHCRDNAYPVTTQWAQHNGRARVGPSSVPRVFSLYGQLSREAGSSLAVSSRNLAGAGRTYMMAVAL